MDEIARRCDLFFRKDRIPTEDIGMIVDEVGGKKSGNKSVCVSRQWLGCLGKQDNGQVAVGVVLCARRLFSLIDMRLFMPESWANDKPRRKEAKIPPSLTFKTKPEIALEMIRKAIDGGIRFGWVGFDALYGSCFWLLEALAGQGVTFVGDIPRDTLVFLEAPEPYVPARKKKSPPSCDQKSIRADRYVESLRKEDWSVETFREGTSKDLTVWFHRKTVWIWPVKSGIEQIQKYTLIVRKEIESGEIKYSLTNAAENITTNKLAFMQGQRYFIEQTFKEGKNQVGMGDCQMRSWNAYHRHMAICMLGLNFIMEQKAIIYKHNPHTTAEDIRRIIEVLLPRKGDSLLEVLESILRKGYQYGNQQVRARERYRKKIQSLIG